MTKLKNSFCVKVISSIVVFTFLTLDIARAGSINASPTQTLAAETGFQLRTEEFRKSILFKAPVLNSVLLTAKYLLEDTTELQPNERLENLKTVIGNETVDSKNPNVKLRDTINLDFVEFDSQSNVVSIPYRTDNNETLYISIALSENLSPNKLAGYKWIISDKYAITILPKKSERTVHLQTPKRVPSEQLKEPCPVISEKPVAEIEIKNSDVSPTSSVLSKTRTITINAVTLTVLVIIAIPLIAWSFFNNTGNADSAEMIFLPSIRQVLNGTPKSDNITQFTPKDAKKKTPGQSLKKSSEVNTVKIKLFQIVKTTPDGRKVDPPKSVEKDIVKFMYQMLENSDMRKPDEYIKFRDKLKAFIGPSIMIHGNVHDKKTDDFINAFKIEKNKISNIYWFEPGDAKVKMYLTVIDDKEYKGTAKDIESARIIMKDILEKKDFLNSKKDLETIIEEKWNRVKPEVAVGLEIYDKEIDKRLISVVVSEKGQFTKTVLIKDLKGNSMNGFLMAWNFDLKKDTPKSIMNSYFETERLLKKMVKNYNFTDPISLGAFAKELAKNISEKVVFSVDIYDKYDRLVLEKFHIVGKVGLILPVDKTKTDDKEKDSMLNIRNDFKPWLPGFPELMKDLRNTANRSKPASPNNTRTKLVNAGNDIREFLNQNAPQIKRDNTTAQVVENLEKALTELDESGLELPEKIKTAKNEIQTNLSYLGIAGMVTGIEILARAAKRKGQNLVIGIDPSWIPGYEPRKLQHNAMNPLVNELKSIPAILERRGLKNVKVIINEDRKDLNKWTSKMEKALNSPGDFSNLITIGDVNTSRYIENNMLQRIPLDNRPLLAEIDPINLQVFYKKHGENEECQLDIDLSEFISITVDIAIGKSAPDLKALKIEFDPKQKKIYYIPNAIKVDYKENAKKNKLNKTTLRSL